MTTHRFVTSKLSFDKPWLKLLVPLVGISLVSCASPTSSLSPTTVAPTEARAFTATLAPTMEPGDFDRSVSVDGQDRTYFLHIPPGVAESTPVPVVVVLHDFTHIISQIRSWTKFDNLSDNNGVVLVYPKGFANSWNSGGCCGMAGEDNLDDVKFVGQILSDLQKTITVDPSRIYAAGLGNGGMMAYRLACEMSETFAAIAAVGGPLFYDQCQPEHSVAVIHIHGLSDPHSPYDGGGDLDLPPVEPGIRKWVQWNGCSNTPSVDVLGAITHTAYPDCEPSATVELYTIDGLEHAWPVPSGAGEQSFPATQTIWDFFVAHPKQ
jgi:polyhydroxybutyrate depolymerase